MERFSTLQFATQTSCLASDSIHSDNDDGDGPYDEKTKRKTTFLEIRFFLIVVVVGPR